MDMARMLKSIGLLRACHPALMPPCLQIRARLAEQVAAGDFYEAQQTYKATYSRYSGKQDWPNAVAILQVHWLVPALCAL